MCHCEKEDEDKVHVLFEKRCVRGETNKILNRIRVMGGILNHIDVSVLSQVRDLDEI